MRGDDFVITEDTEKAMRTISTLLQTGDPKLYNFFLGGEPGSGKNTILEQVAASIKTVDADGVVRQGVPYYEVDISPDLNVDELIGGTTLVAGETKWTPGPLALALMNGTGVVVVNEILRQPKAASILQSIMEDRVIQVKSVDATVHKIPIGDGIIIAMTGNPGSDREASRPAAAAFTRLTPIKIEYGSKDEMMYRAATSYAKREGQKAATPKPKSLVDVFQRDYTIKHEPLQPQENSAAYTVVEEVGKMIKQREIQSDCGGGRPVVPGPRGLDRFIAIGKGSGDWTLAQEMLKGYCTQADEQFAEEWKVVGALFDRQFTLDDQGAWKN